LGGDNPYGYDVVKPFQTDGEPIRGDRTINAAEAEVVCRIFQAIESRSSSRPAMVIKPEI